MIFSDGLTQSMGSKRFCWFDVTIDSIMSTDSPVEPQIIISDRECIEFWNFCFIFFVNVYIGFYMEYFFMFIAIHNCSILSLATHIGNFLAQFM